MNSDYSRDPSPMVPVRSMNLPSSWPRARIVLSAPLVAGIIAGSEDQESEETSEEELPAMPSSKGRHLWSLGDSYGYTKGRTV